MKNQNFFTEFESTSFLNPPTQAQSFPDQQIHTDPQFFESQDANDFSLAHLRNRPADDVDAQYYGHNEWQDDLFEQPLDQSLNSDNCSLILKQQLNSIAKEKQHQLNKYQWSTGKFDFQIEYEQLGPSNIPRRNLTDALLMAEVQTASQSALTKQELSTTSSRSPGLLRKPISKAPKGSLDLKQLLSIRMDILPKASEKASVDYCCKLCGRKFVSQQSLGGHMSKKHPGQS